MLQKPDNLFDQVGHLPGCLLESLIHECAFACSQVYDYSDLFATFGLLKGYFFEKRLLLDMCNTSSLVLHSIIEKGLLAHLT